MLIAWAAAESRGSTRDRQLSPLTSTLPELVKLEVSWLSSTSVAPHLTSEQVSEVRGSPAGFSGTGSQEDTTAGSGRASSGITGGGEKPHGRHSVTCADTLP